MNRQSPGIGWCDYTWNPITGCLNQSTGHCAGFECYARAVYERFGRDFSPRLHLSRLGSPARVRKPSRVFAGSVSDFGSRGVPVDWVNRVYAAAHTLAPWHHYLTLTKRPDRFPAERLPGWWCGVTVTCQRDVRRALDSWFGWLSAEPLLGPLDLAPWPQNIKWLVVGALTKSGRPVPPEDGGTRPQWIGDLIEQACAAGVPVYVKSNARQLFYKTPPQDFPEGLRRGAPTADG